MIIQAEKLATKGYFTRAFNRRKKKYEELIKFHSDLIDMYKAMYDSNNPRGEPEIFIKKIEEMNEEEKTALYNRSLTLPEDYRKSLNRYNKDFDKLDDIDFKLLQIDINTYGQKSVNEDVVIELDYEERLVDNLKKAKDSQVIFTLNKDNITTSNLLYFRKYAREVLKDNKQVRFVVCQDMSKQDNNDRVNYIYTPEEFEMLREVDLFLKKNKCEGVLFREFLEIESEEDLKSAWSLDQVAFVNRHIDRMVEMLKRKNLSPFETMIYLHKFITSNFCYNKGELEESRVLTGIYYRGKIVCSGFATLIKAVVDKLDNPNLKASVLGCKLYELNEPYKQKGAHCQNLIYLKDDKYGIDGYYIEDVTYDVKKMFNGPKVDGGFANCLIPLSALRCYKDSIYASVHDKKRFHNIMLNRKNFKGIDKYYRPYVVREYGKYSTPISRDKYIAAINYAFASQIRKGKLSVKEEIDKSIQRAYACYDYRADIPFLSAEAKILRVIFGKRRK